MIDKETSCPYCQELIQSDANFCPYCGAELNNEIKTERDSTQLNIIYSVILSIIIGFILTYLFSFIYPHAYTNPLIYTCLFSYTLHPLCQYKFNFSKAYEKQNIFVRFIFGFLLFGLIFAIANLGNKITDENSENLQTNVVNTTLQTYNSNEKTLLDYYNEGVNYCLNFQFDGTSSYHNCVMEYIESNGNFEIKKQLKSILHNCEISTTCNVDYKNCVDRVIQKI